MKKRQIYYSRKAGSIVIEGRRKNQTIYLYKLPEPLKLLESLNINKEKKDKIMEKIQSLNVLELKPKKSGEKVRAIKIIRTEKNNDEEDIIDVDSLLEEAEEKLK